MEAELLRGDYLQAGSALGSLGAEKCSSTTSQGNSLGGRKRNTPGEMGNLQRPGRNQHRALSPLHLPAEAQGACTLPAPSSAWCKGLPLNQEKELQLGNRARGVLH